MCALVAFNSACFNPVAVTVFFLSLLFLIMGSPFRFPSRCPLRFSALFLFAALRLVSLRIVAGFRAVFVDLPQLCLINCVGCRYHVETCPQLAVDDLVRCHPVEDEKEIVLLSVVSGLNSNEISVITGLTPGAVRSKLSRSYSKMREFLRS